jgi:hypothetical protein
MHRSEEVTLALAAMVRTAAGMDNADHSLQPCKKLMFSIAMRCLERIAIEKRNVVAQAIERRFMTSLLPRK